METIIQGLNGVVILIDDILITGKKGRNFVVEKVLNRLEKCGLKVSKEKRVFF